MSLTDRSKYYSNLKLSHRNINDLFALHQEALIHSRFDAALKYFEDYASAQFAHMEEEENSIFPFCEEDMNGSEFPGFDVFLGEHRKISESFIHIRVLLNKWVKDNGGNKITRSLRKAEASYIKLLQAHERKEEKYFFPRMERILGEST